MLRTTEKFAWSTDQDKRRRAWHHFAFGQREQQYMPQRVAIPGGLVHIGTFCGADLEQHEMAEKRAKFQKRRGDKVKGPRPATGEVLMTGGDAPSQFRDRARVYFKRKTKPVTARESLMAGAHAVMSEEVRANAVTVFRVQRPGAAGTALARAATGVALKLDVTPLLDLNSVDEGEVYLGVVKSIEGDSVSVEVSPKHEWDTWEAKIPLASFNKAPSLDDEFQATVKVEGPDIRIRARVLPKASLPSLEDLGIDERELLEWASKLNV